MVGKVWCVMNECLSSEKGRNNGWIKGMVNVKVRDIII